MRNNNYGALNFYQSQLPTSSNITDNHSGLKLNIAVNEKTGRYFAGFNGHVYTGEDIDELTKNIALGMMDSVKFVDDFYESGFKDRFYELERGIEEYLILVPEEIPVKTSRGKKPIKNTSNVGDYDLYTIRMGVKRNLVTLYNARLNENIEKEENTIPSAQQKSHKRNFGQNPGRTIKGKIRKKNKSHRKIKRGNSPHRYQGVSQKYHMPNW